LRDCSPQVLREELRGDYRRLALAGYFRSLVADLAPVGPDCQAWYDHLDSTLTALAASRSPQPSRLQDLLNRFDLKVLQLSGLSPDFSGYDRDAEWTAFSVESGAFGVAGGRCMRISRLVAEYLRRLQVLVANGAVACTDGPKVCENLQIPLDAARVIGVFYAFHLDCLSDVRRTVLGMIVKNNEGRF